MSRRTPVGRVFSAKNEVSAGRRSSPDSFRSLGYDVRYAYRVFAKALVEALEPYGVTSSQWAALRVLWIEEGLSQVELAQRMLVEKASLTSVLDAMEAGELIKRRRSSSDRRRVDIYLTAAGKRLEAKLLPLGKKINSHAVQGMSDLEITQLHALIERAVKNLQG